MDFDDAAVEEADKTQKTVRKKKRNSVTEEANRRQQQKCRKRQKKSVGFTDENAEAKEEAVEKRWSSR